MWRHNSLLLLKTKVEAKARTAFKSMNSWFKVMLKMTAKFVSSFKDVLQREYCCKTETNFYCVRERLLCSARSVTKKYNFLWRKKTTVAFFYALLLWVLRFLSFKLIFISRSWYLQTVCSKSLQNSNRNNIIKFVFKNFI